MAFQWKRLIPWCVCLGVAALGASFEVSGSGQILFEVNSFRALLVLALTIFFSTRLVFAEKPRFHASAMVLAAFFALATLLGMQIDATGTLGASELILDESSTDSPVAITLALAVMLISYVIFYYTAVAWAFEKLATVHLKSSETPTTLFGKQLSYRLCLTILLIAWLPYLIIFFPGGVTADTSRHLAQFFEVGGLSLDTHFPYLEAVIFGGLYEFLLPLDPSGYLGVFAMELLQTAVGLCVFSTVVMALDDIRAPKPLVIGALAFFAVFPLVPVYVVSISKDTLHAMLFALFALQLLMLFAPSSSSKRPKALLLASSLPALLVTGLLVSLLRNGSIVVVVVSLLAAGIAKRSPRLFSLTALTAALFCCFQFVITPLAGVSGEGPQEMLSTPVQVIASQSAEELEQNEEMNAALADLFDVPPEEVPGLYDPFLSDQAKAHLSIENIEGAARLVGLSLRAVADDPVPRMGAALATTYGFWYPFYIGTYFIEDAPYFCEGGHGWSKPEWFASVDDLASRESAIKPFQQILHFVHFTPVISLLYSPAAYLWLILFVLGFSVFSGRNRKQVLIVSLPFLMLALILVAGPCASLRYALPFAFSLPILIAMLIGCLEKDKGQGGHALDLNATPPQTLMGGC